MHAPPPPDRLLLIVDKATCSAARRDPVKLCRALLEAGAGWIWYRNRVDSAALRFEEASRLVELTAATGAELSVGDRPDIASAIGARGVHLSATGIPVAAARSLPGIRWVGRSCHGRDSVLRAHGQNADYATLSPIYPTTSPKTAPRPPLGLAELHGTVGAVGLPVYALGGIRADRVAPCLGAGAHGVAVLGAIVLADDPVLAYRSIREALTRAIEGKAGT